jgi:hypothetical protein
LTKKKLLYISSIVILLLIVAVYGLYLLAGWDSSSPISNITPSPSSSVSESRVDGYSADNKLPNTNHLAGQEQKMVYNANLYLYVSDIQVARNKLDEVAKKTQSYIVSSADTEKNQASYTTITYRVKQGQFQSFINYVKKLSDKPPSVQIQGQDVSEEVVDLEARLKAKQAMEARLLDMMKKATTTSDLLDVETTLGTTQEQIEQIKGRLQYLQHRIDYSTVIVEISQSEYQPVQANNSLGTELIQGFISSTKDVWIGLQLLIISFARILPFLIVLAVIVYPTLLIIKKVRKK